MADIRSADWYSQLFDNPNAKQYAESQGMTSDQMAKLFSMPDNPNSLQQGAQWQQFNKIFGGTQQPQQQPQSGTINLTGWQNPEYNSSLIGAKALDAVGLGTGTMSINPTPGDTRDSKDFAKSGVSAVSSPTAYSIKEAPTPTTSVPSVFNAAPTLAPTVSGTSNIVPALQPTAAPVSSGTAFASVPSAPIGMEVNQRPGYSGSKLYQHAQGNVQNTIGQTASAAANTAIGNTVGNWMQGPTGTGPVTPQDLGTLGPTAGQIQAGVGLIQKAGQVGAPLQQYSQQPLMPIQNAIPSLDQYKTKSSGGFKLRPTP
jgi:hypothetical protein